MNVKRGQISIFILFGLVILIILGFLIYLNNQIEEVKQEVEKQITLLDLSTPIKNYVDLCLKRTGEDALNFVGIQGGFFENPTYSIDSKGIFFELFHTVYLQNNKSVMPSLQTIEKEISDYIDNHLENCINDFKDFNNLGYKIETDALSTTTLISEDTIVFNLDFPLTVERGQKSNSIENFFVEIPSRMNLIYNLAEIITNDQLNHLGQICISCLIELGDANNFYFELIPRKANITIIAIEDNQTLIDNDPYIFVFAINHSITAV